MKTETFNLPTFWASPLINGDYSSLSDDDETAINAFIDDMVADYGQCWCLTCSDDESDFRTYHDAKAYGVLACNVLTFTFDVTQR